MSSVKFKLIAAFTALFLFSVLISCKKTDQNLNKDNSTKENVETTTAGEEFTEKDEDLLNVDYKEFYDELAPYGEWVEVTDKDIGLDLKKSSAGNKMQHRTITIAELFGIKDAIASDVSFGAFFIWKPSPNLAVTIVAGDPQPHYVPYSNGQWVNTDAGWYFKAPTPYEEVCHHHGRWVYSPALGWVWVPGRVWAPAWVDWRENDGYIAWTPVPPGIYIVNNVIIAPPLYEERYIIVEKRYFCEPEVYKYKYMYKENKNKIMIKEMTRIDGVMIKEKFVINKGPDVTVIEKIRGSKIDLVKVNRVNNKSDIKVSQSEINTYSPKFEKVKSGNNENAGTTKPSKYETFNDAKVKSETSGKSKIEGEIKENTQDKNVDKNKDKSKKNSDKSKGIEKQNGKNKDDGTVKGHGKDKGKNDGKNKSDGNDKKDNGSKQHEHKSKDNVDKSKDNSQKNNKGKK